MVNDIRPSLPQVDLLRQISEYRTQNVERGVRVTNKNIPTPSVHSARPAVGISLVEEVFNQIYSKSGFLDEQEVARSVTPKVELLGRRLDVYA